MQHPIADTAGPASLGFGLGLGLTLLAAASSLPALAANPTVAMHKLTQDGTGEATGSITLATTQAGTTFKLDLHGLPPGPHGFHIHENANCGPTLVNGVRIPGGAAGSHLDPNHTSKHEGPTGDGHLGDLPALEVAADGTATQTLAAPHIKSPDLLAGRALMIHSGSDNYSDQPSPLGGGGSRIACGLVE